ncbi:MAG: DUF4876 domain-containing protein [Bacteroidales bacterium]|nr:DUF4876 domain-containing protein [Bacteroidales bacterium]
MKKICAIIAAVLAIVAVSCNKDKGPKVFEVPVQLTDEKGDPIAEEGISVILASNDASFEQLTGPDGSVTFKVPVGVYTVSVSYRKVVDDVFFNYNGNASITVNDPFEGTVSVPMVYSKTSKLIIKEVYNGGCVDNAGTGSFTNDKYLIVYNNSDTEVDASKMCLAMAQISNAISSNNYAITDGVIEYDTAGWTPASFGIWWFQDGTQVKIAPYSQILISIQGAVDHTKTYTNSVDLSNADYCLYDLESGFNMASHYPAPSSNIPQSHYMKTYRFGLGTAWSFPMQTAAPFIFMDENNIKEAVKDAKNFDKRTTNLSGNYFKVPNEWILDAVDIWSAADETKFFLRFPQSVNVGYEAFPVNKKGYSIYRNVDKAATEAIPENEGKLVYNYSGAVYEEDTDPSGIDAEASIAAGAKIVYSDTNNSDTDFHVRKVASIKK